MRPGRTSLVTDYTGERGDPDWNALKRLERKAREKGGYTEALMEACGLNPDIDMSVFSKNNIRRIIAATLEQVAIAILSVLEE